MDTHDTEIGTLSVEVKENEAPSAELKENGVPSAQDRENGASSAQDKENGSPSAGGKEHKHHKRKYKKKSSKMGSTPEPRRKRGVTETPDMNVVIGYNLYSEGINKLQGEFQVPRIVLDSDPLPDPEAVAKDGLPGFETVNQCKRVIFRRVPGNDFFFELIKTNVEHERVFLVCEPTEGTKLLNLSGRNFNIMFLGREGKELLSIRPCPNTKETVSVLYKQQELGRIIRHPGGDTVSSTSPSHSILDRNLQRAFILRKRVQVIRSKNCCFNKGNRKVDNGYNIFIVKKSGTAMESTEEEISVGSIGASETEIKFTGPESPNKEQLGLEETTLLLATLVTLKTKALQSAGLGFRLSLAF